MNQKTTEKLTEDIITKFYEVMSRDDILDKRIWSIVVDLLQNGRLSVKVLVKTNLDFEDRCAEVTGVFEVDPNDLSWEFTDFEVAEFDDDCYDSKLTEYFYNLIQSKVIRVMTELRGNYDARHSKQNQIRKDFEEALRTKQSGSA